MAFLPETSGGWGDLLNAGQGMFTDFLKMQQYNGAQDIASQENALKLQLMRQAMADAKLGGANARGDRTYFDPARGWVTDLSQTGQALQTGSDQEMLAMLQNDLPLKRALMQQQFARQQQEGSAADSIRNELMLGPEMSRDTLESLFRSRAQRDVNESFDREVAGANRTGLRTGADTSSLMAKLAGKRAEMLGNAGIDSKLNAINAFDSMEGNRVNRGSSLYNMMASRASGNLNTQFNPFQSDDVATIGANSQAQLGGATRLGAQTSLAFPQMNVPTLGDKNGNSYMGNYVMGIGTPLSDAMKKRQLGNV